MPTSVKSGARIVNLCVGEPSSKSARSRPCCSVVAVPPAMRPILDAPKKNQIVQATFWHLAKQDVTSAVEFGLGRPSRAIDFSTYPHMQEFP